MRKKNINVISARVLITVALAKIDIDEMVDDVWKLLTEDPNGPEVTDEMIRKYLVKLLDKAKVDAENIVSGITLPVDVPEEPEPEPIKDEYEFLKRYDGLRPIAGKQFTWLLNIRLKGTIKFVWPECNQELVVPNADITHGADGNRDNHWQAFYFTKEDHEEHNFAASIFAKPGCKATYVEVWQKL